MEYVIQGRKPEALFHYFEEISAIPRESYHEEKIADYLVDFAKARGLEWYRDTTNNVFIKLPATKGMENKAPVLLQGHTDMVCEKNSGVEHDFSKDPLKLYVDGDLLRARGTTLGADDGSAVAMMLTILDGGLETHPPIECLFTAAEETGMDGAKNFDYSLISARRMINLDIDSLGNVFCGCAGGVRSDLELQYQGVDFAGEAVSVKLTGLVGGHSGSDINKGRANANKLMGRLLAALIASTDARLVSVNGGSKENAIPRECEAIVAVPDAEKAMDILTDTAAQIAGELSDEDRNFNVKVETVEAQSFMLTKDETLRAVTVMCCSAIGALSMSQDIVGLVESSRNLGVIFSDEEKINFMFSSRSSVESKLDASILELDTLAAATGCAAKHYGRYPGWSFAKTSELRSLYLDAYREVTGKEGNICVVHAGLECGIIYSKIPMDIIAIGPTATGIHCPDEAWHLNDVEIFWKTLVKLLEKL